ncbi:SPFH domain-containing protein [Schaalia sp. ZJ405]|uniref:SPFH domain-containing protein n=1 Tax=Schaalia sp. ZJ405 TaxID=2709403 RepID=UPI0013E9ED5D|nr:SPFH domain-containing protein [Schaalia sp. ZJ405]QPK81519.1 SPFH domain-containing protein [Schaalia sp. ZJ405]
MTHNDVTNDGVPAVADDEIVVATSPHNVSPRVDICEKPARSLGSGVAFLVLLLIIASLAGAVPSFVMAAISEEGGGEAAEKAGLYGLLGGVLIVLFLILLTTLTIVPPGQTSVRQFFGKYIGTVRRTGLVIVPPFTGGKKVSVKVHNFETHELKVNDSDGNPINIAAIVVWQVADTARAVFAVEQYEEFIQTQAEAALRHVATTHPYDEPGPGETSLRGATDLVSEELAEEVAARVALAGLEIVEVRISSLAYAPEIAQAMLQRQQAGAVIAAREQIVEGAVSMVNQALARLENEGIVDMDDERRAQMVSNLLVVLCSDQRTQPVVNTGSLYA